MKAEISFECDCGNKGSYLVKWENKYGDNYYDLTDSVKDDSFKATAEPEGFILKCNKCEKHFEFI